MKKSLTKLLIFVSCSVLSSATLASNQIESRSSICRVPAPLPRGPHSSEAWYLCLREEINNQWMMQKPHILAEYRCTYNLLLDDAGKLSDLKLLSSSGPAEIDKNLQCAVRQAFLLQQNSRELARNKKFRMEFDESEQPKIHFKDMD